MKRSKIEGSMNIAEIGYDLPSRTLQIKFLSGGIYDYWPVTRTTYDQLVSAKSVGSYFFKNIRGVEGINYRRVDL